MRIQRCSILIGLLCAAGTALASDGLNVDKIGGYWSAQQTQLQLNAVVVDAPASWSAGGPSYGWAGPATAAASLGGDYYFSKRLADSAAPQSGLRASGAVLVRPSGVSLSELAWASRSMSSFAAPGRPILGYRGTAVYDAQPQAVDALPYLGIGYSDYSLKSGWGFWADIGLVVQSPGAIGGLGRTVSGTQGLEDVVRELQLSPMLQLGVNYSF